MEDKSKHYMKKPKSILVLDCVYLDKERDTYRELYFKEQREHFVAKQKLTATMGKSAILQDAMSKLIDVVTSLKNATGIGPG